MKLDNSGSKLFLTRVVIEQEPATYGRKKGGDIYPTVELGLNKIRFCYVSPFITNDYPHEIYSGEAPHILLLLAKVCRPKTTSITNEDLLKDIFIYRTAIYFISL